jgi:RHS repeat-associated protein
VSLDYQYDRADNIAQIDDRLDAAASQAFAYDAESRLTQADGRYGLLDFAYDDNGNRTRLNDGGRLSTYSYLANSNKLKSIAGDQARSFNYNANGDINRVADIVLAYGDHDRVIRAHRAGVTLGSYVYNGLGQRVRKTTAAGTRHFQYSPDGLLLGEYDGTGRTIQEYVYLDTMPLAILGDPAQAWRVFFAHSDHLDTLVKVTNGAGNLVWDAERRPFGETTLKLQQIQVPLRFPGQYYDAETGLYYNYFRDFDPSTGRYIQSDPIGLAGGLNTYAYVGGNPLRYTDPLGLNPVAGVIGGGAVAGPPGAVVGGVIGLGIGIAFGDAMLNGMERRGFEPDDGPSEGASEGAEPWPGGENNRGFCIRLYAECINNGWTGNCQTCMDRCIASQNGNWPFRGRGGCHPRKKRCK